MFGPRRRRPILGTALMVGVASSAAKRQVSREAQLAAQSQREFDMTVQQQVAADKERERQTQLAIEKALKEERDRNAAQAQLQAQSQPVFVPQQVPPDADVRKANPDLGGLLAFCAACGNRRAVGEKFCPQCGKRHVDVHPGLAQGEPSMMQPQGM